MRKVAVLVSAVGVVLAGTATGAGKQPPPPTQAKVVQTGRAPCGATARSGSLWVGVYEAGKVLRINPISGRIAKRIPVGRWACRLTVDKRAIWVTRDQAGLLVRVDLRTGRKASYKVGATPFDVLLAKGSIWVSSYDVGTIAQIDAATRRPVRVFRDGGFPAGLALCGGRVWVGHGRDVTWLTAIDPTTHEIMRVDVGAATPSTPRCVRGTLWATTTDSVSRVDPQAGEVLSRLQLGGTPADIIAAPDGLVWVTDKERSLVIRVDPQGKKVVDTFPAGPGAFAFARVGRSIWVTSFAGADVRRYDS
jgi:streptogramin lyase